MARGLSLVWDGTDVPKCDKLAECDLAHFKSRHWRAIKSCSSRADHKSSRDIGRRQG
jgi:hypothetical protein